MRAFCLATGPSLTQEQVDKVRGKGAVYAVNDAYRLAPWADFLYACDEDWWDVHITPVRGMFRGELWTQSERAEKDYGINRALLVGKYDGGLSDKGLIGGGNSGYQAINLAYLHGHRDIVLLGYDMKLGENGKRHFFGSHPEGLEKKSAYTNFVQHFAKMRPERHGVTITNCTPGSALDCFAMKKLDDVLI